MISIDHPTKKQKDIVIDIWNKCFKTPKQFVDIHFYSALYKEENTLCLFDNGVMTSVLQIIPMEISVGDCTMSCGYVFGAATLKEYRNKGYMAKLINASFDVIYERGWLLSSLIPFDFYFYKKFGYEPCFYLNNVYASLNEGFSYDSTVKSFSGNLQELEKIYRKFTSNKYSYVMRSGNIAGEENVIWKNVLADINISGDCFFIPNEGYTLCSVSNNGVGTIHELCALSPSAADRLITAAALKMGGEKLLLHLSTDFNVNDLKCISVTQQNTEPFAMARIINVNKIMEYMSRHSLVPTDKKIRISDNNISLNNGVFLNGKRIGEEKEDSSKYIDICELTEILFSGGTNYFKMMFE